MGNATGRWSAYDFLFNCNRNYAAILYRFRHIASYLSKFAAFNLLHLHLTPPLGVTQVEFRRDLWHEKTRVPELSCDFVCVILCVAFLVEHRLVTDTDRQTRGHIIYRISIASRCKKQRP